MTMRFPLPHLIAAVLSTVAFDANAQTLRPTVDAINTTAAAATVDRSAYVFADDTIESTTLEHAFRPPKGFTRVESTAGSFASWLRGLPIRLDRQHVLSHAGSRLTSPSAAIVAIDVGKRNLQQCADTAIRLHAEYLWASGRSAELAYHFTSGDEVKFSDWVKGERIVVDGAKVARKRGEPRAANHASMRRWLDLVFMYAGTRSLHRDSVTISPRDAQPGDFFVAPGSPGHAVVILDIVTSPDGRRTALLGQGFMPAQDLHVLRANKPHTVDGAWFILPDEPDDQLHTPSWKPFRGSDLRRFAGTQ